jgi:lipopolysaccharide/colanic/teichoic acid biosynthesis glycosyltransferase
MYRLLERLFALILLVLSLPLLGILYVIVRLESPGPFLFLQLRAGKGKKPFWIYKIRTMVQGSESLKSKVKRLNEVDGPVFKIRNDPRYTRVGKLLSHIALDELPQLMNVIEGNMTFVGPRPLPLDEAAQVPKKYITRFSVMPGITSSWIVEGAHEVSFKKWMELDCQYAKKHTIMGDIIILLKTVGMVGRMIIKNA